MAFVHTEQQTKFKELSILVQGRGLQFFRSLSNLLYHKYKRNFRLINDINVEHLVILSEQYVDMATVITFDFRRGYTEFAVINRFAEVGSILGMISHKNSLKTIFGHNHKIKHFIKNLIFFMKKFKQPLILVHIWYEIANFETKSHQK